MFLLSPIPSHESLVKTTRFCRKQHCEKLKHEFLQSINKNIDCLSKCAEKGHNYVILGWTTNEHQIPCISMYNEVQKDIRDIFPQYYVDVIHYDDHKNIGLLIAWDVKLTSKINHPPLAYIPSPSSGVVLIGKND